VRRWEQQVSELYQLPPAVKDLRNLVLEGRTFRQQRGSLRQYPRETIGRFMYERLGPPDGSKRTHTTVYDAAAEAEEKFQCGPASAKKWYYLYCKNLSH